MQKIIPRVQDYPWGSKRWIPEFLGLPASDGKPWAELWYGAHSKAPSRVDGSDADLLRWIKDDPDRILGSRVVHAFGPQLPFLLKLLAAAEPLSIQCHPTREQAREGYERENRLGIPLDSPQRNYKDPNHKPEILLALHPCTALCGFRSPVAILEGFSRLVPLVPDLEEFFPLLERGDLAGFFRTFLTLPRKVLGSWIRTCRTHLFREGDPARPEDRWFGRLADRYPDDPGCFAPFYLNLVELAPGEALFLEAGILHAYLMGFGIELMANSDNVLRGGLTSKHMDVEELLKIVRFEARDPMVVRPEQRRIQTPEGTFQEDLYRVPVSEFSLSLLRFTGRADGVPLPVTGPEILLCGGGEWELRRTPEDEPISLKRGEACFVDAGIPTILLWGGEPESGGMLVRARVPLDG
ncbi:MAG: mannose-6-phosphate isomerase, class I [Spirochaetales bacterium]